MRNAGVWAYGIVNLTHILGVSSLFGAVLVLDLRLLGFWRSVPLASIARPTVPVATIGFIVAATSGLCLISTNGSEYAGNPFLLIKFPAIVIGVLNVTALGRPAGVERARCENALDDGTASVGRFRRRFTAVVVDGDWSRQAHRVRVVFTPGGANEEGHVRCPELRLDSNARRRGRGAVDRGALRAGANTTQGHADLHGP